MNSSSLTHHVQERNVLQKTPSPPANVERAGDKQTTIGEKLIRLLRLKTSYRNRMAKLMARRDEEVGRSETELFAHARAQEKFALANRQMLFKNGVEFMFPKGGSMQLKETATSVRCEDLDEASAVAALKDAGAPEDCINYRPTVHKTNLKKAIEDDPELQAKLEEKGFRFENGLMFTLNFSGCDAKLKHNAEHPELPFFIDLPKEKEKGAIVNGKTAST